MGASVVETTNMDLDVYVPIVKVRHTRAGVTVQAAGSETMLPDVVVLDVLKSKTS